MALRLFCSFKARNHPTTLTQQLTRRSKHDHRHHARLEVRRRQPQPHGCGSRGDRGPQAQAGLALRPGPDRHRSPFHPHVRGRRRARREGREDPLLPAPGERGLRRQVGEWRHHRLPRLRAGDRRRGVLHRPDRHPGRGPLDLAPEPRSGRPGSRQRAPGHGPGVHRRPHGGYRPEGGVGDRVLDQPRDPHRVEAVARKRDELRHERRRPQSIALGRLFQFNYTN